MCEFYYLCKTQDEHEQLFVEDLRSLFVDFHKDLKIKLMPDQMGSLLVTV